MLPMRRIDAGIAPYLEGASGAALPAMPRPSALSCSWA